MTFNHKEASEKLQELYDCGVLVGYVDDNDQVAYHYITQDKGTMAALAFENYISIQQAEFNQYVYAGLLNKTMEYFNREDYKDHNNDKIEATCVAIYNALIKLKE